LVSALKWATLAFPTGHKGIYSLLQNSRLFRESHNLLRNDSMSDILTRSILFLSLFKFLSFVAHDPDAIKLINEHPPDHTDPSSEPHRKKPLLDPAASAEHSPSCLDLFESLVRQCSVFEKTLHKSSEPSFSSSADVIDVVSSSSSDQVIQAIRQTNSSLLAATFRAPILLNDDDDDDDDYYWPGAYDKKLKPLSFTQTAISANHSFASGISTNSAALPYYKRPVSFSNTPSNRLNRIAKEIASLSTNLPVNEQTSIFVLADEDRIDLLKAIVTGPAGTPYEHGVFEFGKYLSNYTFYCFNSMPSRHFPAPRISICSAKGKVSDHKARIHSLQPQSLYKRICLSIAAGDLVWKSGGEVEPVKIYTTSSSAFHPKPDPC
jgi:baculoviral IAP repeat-containing protein 6